ncbi:cysteine peptidase family C39 domain-containing protein [Sphingobacterium sp. UBA5670]|uniref:cysteine peptidase family C39 domain-containing protein n=1 Tax=Sphingobacterium sp. UBA5670 TaxID=1947502 RepID=UPI0025EE69B7|nr:cysteine peptidase family C39 domain-containing protein [Sphingobacterium sp. UBA5670]
MNLFKSIHPSYEGNILKVCRSVLDIFDVRFTKTFIKKIIDNHLDPGSLLAVTDILSEYGVETVAVKKGDYQYSDFELPFICCIQEEGWSQAGFVLVKDVNGDNIKYLDPSDNHFKYLSSTGFENIDKGIILLLDESNKRDEIDYRKHLENERTSYWISKLPLLLVSMTVMFPICSKIFLSENIPWESLIFLATSLVGAFVSILLLWHEVDAFNPFIREVWGLSQQVCK